MAVAIPIATAGPTGVASDGSNNSTYTGLSTGAAAKGKLVVLFIGKEVATVVLNSITIDDGSGSGVRSMTLIGGTTFGNVGAWMYRASVDDASSTATFVLNWSGAVSATNSQIAVYALSDAAAPQSYSGTNTSTDMDATVPLTTGSTVIATGGGMLAGAMCADGSVGKTWANLTEDIDVNTTGSRFTTALSITAGTATRTCTGTTNGEDGVLVYAHFTDSSEPELNMMRYRPA